MLKSNARQLAAKNRVRAKNLQRNLRVAMAETDVSAKETAREYSSGTFPSVWLRMMAAKRGAGLYSKRRPAPPADPGIINQQSGQLKAGWSTQVAVTADNFVVKLSNSAPYARWMKGTKKMIVRPIINLIMKAERPKVLRRYRAAIQKTLKS